MRCFIDSNILFSAGLFPNGVVAAALIKAFTPPNEVVVSDYSLDEVRRAVARKFPHKVNELETFLYRILFTAQLVVTQEEEFEDETAVRDIKDRPILRAARHAKVDVLITGDKDLLEAGITDPQIMDHLEFLKL